MFATVEWFQGHLLKCTACSHAHHTHALVIFGQKVGHAICIMRKSPPAAASPVVTSTSKPAKSSATARQIATMALSSLVLHEFGSPSGGGIVGQSRARVIMVHVCHCLMEWPEQRVEGEQMGRPSALPALQDRPCCLLCTRRSLQQLRPTHVCACPPPPPTSPVLSSP